MKNDGTLLKRIVAFLLMLALVFSSGDFIPVIATAIAEGEAVVSTEEQPEVVPPVSETGESESAENRAPASEDEPAPVGESAVVEAPEPAAGAEPRTLNIQVGDYIITATGVIEAMARALSVDSTALTASRLAKALLPLTYMNTLATRTAPITKARYGDEENKAAAAVFDMDVKKLLGEDLRIDLEKLASYRMWENNATFHSVYLLPNALRLYMRTGNWLDYVTDILQGEVLNDGYSYEIEVITALNEYAYDDPEIPIGRTGRLNFRTGTLTIPSYTDFELYLHELSAAWLTEQIESGYIRTLMCDQDEINVCATEGSDKQPDGTIIEGMIDGGTVEGIRLYWIGDTPETAAAPDQTLILLMVNEQTDEVDAFRTSVNMLSRNEPLVDVSMYLFRDSESDRREEEKYNAFWFDSFEPDLSLVKVLTNVVSGKNLEVPRPIRIILRAYTLEGVGLPVYSLTDHLFLMCDGTKGTISLFDGSYRTAFDGDTFESNYIRIEGIAAGDLVMTILKGQDVWQEVTQ